MYFLAIKKPLRNYCITLLNTIKKKGTRSQTQTPWKNYCELEKQLRTVSFWLGHVREDAVMFCIQATARTFTDKDGIFRRLKH